MSHTIDLLPLDCRYRSAASASGGILAFLWRLAYTCPQLRRELLETINRAFHAPFPPCNALYPPSWTVRCLFPVNLSALCIARILIGASSTSAAQNSRNRLFAKPSQSKAHRLVTRASCMCSTYSISICTELTEFLWRACKRYNDCYLLPDNSDAVQWALCRIA